MAILIFLICFVQSLSANASGIRGIPHEFRREVDANASAPAACNDGAFVPSVCNSYYPDLGLQPLKVQAGCLRYIGIKVQVGPKYIRWDTSFLAIGFPPIIFLTCGKIARKQKNSFPSIDLGMTSQSVELMLVRPMPK